MQLHYLNFDYSEDTEGTATFEAMASVWPDQVAAVHAEIVAVLDWAHQAFPGLRGLHDTLADGGQWDYDLHGVCEFTAPQQLRYDAATRQLTAQLEAPGQPRHTVTLLLSASAEFGAAFSQALELE